MLCDGPMYLLCMGERWQAGYKLAVQQAGEGSSDSLCAVQWAHASAVHAGSSAGRHIGKQGQQPKGPHQKLSFDTDQIAVSLRSSPMQLPCMGLPQHTSCSPANILVRRSWRCQGSADMCHAVQWAHAFAVRGGVITSRLATRLNSLRGSA